MRFLLFLLGGLVLFGCTPTVKEVALYKGKGQIEVVKRGNFFFSEEEKGFISREAKRLGIEVPRNEDIERHIRKLLRSPRSLELALRRANLYIPYIKPILLKKGLPEELSLLPLIESGFNPFAVSRSGAAGIWQLMPQTARRYGLRVDKEVDERFDLLKSTEAATSYLKDLYRKFGDWELVLAALQLR
ncbi:MAG: lytic transglycosylase domain-containing protein [Aquificota bacterium]|nr:lytic transglycosylase domain-containing protein [Aquificota bacterium]